MLKTIRKYALLVASISVALPIVHFSLAKLNLMLFNFGPKGLVAALVIYALAMHEYILPSKLLNKSHYISLGLTIVDLILVISALFITLSKLKKVNSLPVLSIISKFNNTDFTLGWGWYPLIAGLIISIICTCIIIIQEKKLIVK